MPSIPLIYRGIAYRSIKEAAIANGLAPHKVAYHIRNGNSLDDAFSKSNCNNKLIVADGATYSSVTCAATTHGLNPKKFPSDSGKDGLWSKH